jgi:aspartyl-tRNA(Asn)/glutamyl-tRNA(Gln) amidotransferase subunit C
MLRYIDISLRPVQEFPDMDERELRTTAQLAQLDLSDDEAAVLGAAVERMLGYFSKMSEIDVSTLVPTTHALQTSNRLRPDCSASSDAADALLERAPELEGRLIVIPNVL